MQTDKPVGDVARDANFVYTAEAVLRTETDRWTQAPTRRPTIRVADSLQRRQLTDTQTSARDWRLA